MTPISVVDSLMGSGKTTGAIRLMKSIISSPEYHFPDDHRFRRFIYITPFLDEVSRIKDSLNSGPTVAYEPIPEGGKKIVSLNSMLADGKNVVSTHALFKFINGDTEAALGEYSYTLIIDEVAEWVTQYPISVADLKILLSSKTVTVDKKTKRVSWVDVPGIAYKGNFGALRTACMEGKIVVGRRRADGLPSLLLWTMPVEILQAFERVFILTHLFEGSDMAAYLKLNEVAIEKLTVDRDGNFGPYDAELEKERVAKLKPLIRVVDDPKLNGVGEKKGKSRPLSVSWFQQDRSKFGKTKVNKLAKATYLFYNSRLQGQKIKPLWSTYKDFKKDLGGKGYSRSFLSCTARATNDYRECNALAYLVNLYRHPFISGYYRDAGVETSEDFYALSTMTQWVFRSAIRMGEPVDLFVPSSRMRKLLTDWLDGVLPVVGQGDDDADDEVLESTVAQAEAGDGHQFDSTPADEEVFA